MRYLESAVKLQFDDTLCNGCAMCTKVCPHGVFAMSSKKAVVADRGACMECGACARNCEHGAIQVRAGVGCAAGLMSSVFSRTEPTKASCGCSGDSSGCC